MLKEISLQCVSFVSFVLEIAGSALWETSIHHISLKQKTVWQDRSNSSREIDSVGSCSKWSDERWISKDERVASSVSPCASSANRAVIDETSDSMSVSNNERKRGTILSAVRYIRNANRHHGPISIDSFGPLYLSSISFTNPHITSLRIPFSFPGEPNSRGIALVRMRCSHTIN